MVGIGLAMISVQLTEQGVIYPWSIHGFDVLGAGLSKRLFRKGRQARPRRAL
jgi:hypothetical protein